MPTHPRDKTPMRGTNGKSTPQGLAVVLRDTIVKRLGAYAVTAGAGAGLLVCAQPAQADIVYTPANTTLTGGTLSIDLTNNGTADFRLTNLWSFSKAVRPLMGSAVLRLLSINGLGITGNQVMAYPGGNADALQAGARIGPGAAFAPGSHEMASGVNTYPSMPGFGPWANVSDRYLGLQFQLSGQTYYGWAELSVTAFGGSIEATLQGYAYDTVAGQQILAGQTTATPEPGTLGLLAAGSLGLAFWRRKKERGGCQAK